VRRVTACRCSPSSPSCSPSRSPSRSPSDPPLRRDTLTWGYTSPVARFHQPLGTTTRVPDNIHLHHLRPTVKACIPRKHLEAITRSPKKLPSAVKNEIPEGIWFLTASAVLHCLRFFLRFFLRLFLRFFLRFLGTAPLPFAPFRRTLVLLCHCHGPHKLSA
jgi:hypothetical protein